MLCISTQADEKDVSVWVDMQRVEGAFIENGVTYVPIRAFYNASGAESVEWDGEKRVATVKLEGTEIKIFADKEYMSANGRYIFLGKPAKNVDGRMCVAIRLLAKTVNGDVTWDGENKRVYVESGGVMLCGDKFYDETDVLWLSRIIYAESRGEPFEGKLAVGCVVMNRVESDEFPDDVYSVIFDRKYGVQFTPTSNGTINNTPDESCVIAAKLCLEGVRVADDALYFVNERIAKSAWVSRNREKVMEIGNHTFFN